MFQDDLQRARIETLATQLASQTPFVSAKKIHAGIMAVYGFLSIDTKMKEAAIQNFKLALTILENL